MYIFSIYFFFIKLLKYGFQQTDKGYWWKVLRFLSLIWHLSCQNLGNNDPLKRWTQMLRLQNIHFCPLCIELSWCIIIIIIIICSRVLCQGQTRKAAAHVSFLHDMMKKPYTRLQDTLQKNLHTLIDNLLALDTETLPLLSTVNGPLHHNITQTHTLLWCTE